MPGPASPSRGNLTLHNPSIALRTLLLLDTFNLEAEGESKCDTGVSGYVRGTFSMIRRPRVPKWIHLITRQVYKLFQEAVEKTFLDLG